MCFFIFHIEGRRGGGKVLFSTLELKSLAEVGLGSLALRQVRFFSSFQHIHTTFGCCLFFFYFSICSKHWLRRGFFSSFSLDNKKGGLNGYASSIHNIQTLFFFWLWLLPRLELGEGRGLGGVIYTRSFWSFLYISLCWTLEREGFLEDGGKGWVFWLEIGQDMMCVCQMYYIYTRNGGSGSGSKAEGKRRRRMSTILGEVLCCNPGHG